MKKNFVSIITLAVMSVSCTRPISSCSDHLAEGKAPEFINQKLAANTKLLCYEGYTVMHSGQTHTPLWSAEHLTTSSIHEAKQVEVSETFYAEPLLSDNERAELHDYNNASLGRGQMATPIDMPTENAARGTFSLANVVPQNQNNSRILWKGIEASARNFARWDGEAYVITGPIFEGSALQRLNDRVLIPTALFKAIYVPSRKAAGAYVAQNNPGIQYQTVSIAELEKRIGLNLFPTMPANIKEEKMNLHVPLLTKTN